MATEEQIQNRLEFAETELKDKQYIKIVEIKTSLERLSEGFGSRYEELRELKLKNNRYLVIAGRNAEKYGFEFPDLQKKYEAMLPRINKYLGVKAQ